MDKLKIITAKEARQNSEDNKDYSYERIAIMRLIEQESKKGKTSIALDYPDIKLNMRDFQWLEGFGYTIKYPLYEDGMYYFGVISW